MKGFRNAGTVFFICLMWTGHLNVFLRITETPRIKKIYIYIYIHIYTHTLTGYNSLFCLNLAFMSIFNFCQITFNLIMFLVYFGALGYSALKIP